MDKETVESAATHSSHLLIAEDDVPLAQFLKRGLEADKYAVNLVHDGEGALQAAQTSLYDLVILDLNLPKLDGLAVLKQLRPAKPLLPVLVLTGRSQLEDRVTALDGGADDCLIKPFSFRELSARARALLRRNQRNSGKVMQIGDLVLDREELRVERGGKRLDLTGKEFLVLECLMLNARHPVSRATLMEYAWKTPYDSSTNLVDVYVKYVRDKVDGSFPVKLLRTIRGVGYVMADN